MKLYDALYDGDSTIVVRFAETIGSLVLDTLHRAGLPNYGLEYVDESGSAQIASVTLQNNATELLVELDQTPSGANPRLRYAKSGNLRDSQARGTSRTPTYNWCDAFDVALR